MSSPDRPKVFICHSSDDAAEADKLFRHLDMAGAEPWLDKRNLALGDDWESEIKKAVAQADVFVVCLRRGFDDIGFRQQEVRWAIEALQKRPPGRGFIIPFILEPCELPAWCEPFHAGSDLSRPTGYAELLQAVEKHSGKQLCPTDPQQARVSALIENLALDHADDRYAAIEALGEIGPAAERAVQPLAGILGDPNVGEAAAKALAAIGSICLPDVICALDDSDALVRKHAATALWEMRGEAAPAVSRLTARLCDPDKDVRATAAIALGQIGDAASSAIPALCVACKDPDDWVRVKATYALGEIGSAAIPTLVGILHDPSYDVQVDAARAIGDMGRDAAQAIPDVIEELENADPELRYWAVRALEDIGDASQLVLEALSALSNDSDEKVRKESQEALERLSSDAEAE